MARNGDTSTTDGDIADSEIDGLGRHHVACHRWFRGFNWWETEWDSPFNRERETTDSNRGGKREEGKRRRDNCSAFPILSSLSYVKHTPCYLACLFVSLLFVPTRKNFSFWYMYTLFLNWSKIFYLFNSHVGTYSRETSTREARNAVPVAFSLWQSHFHIVW